MSSFSPTATELALVNSIFAIADPQKLGIITGDKAVEAFSGAGLPPSVLGEVWALADRENNGFLTRKGVAIAVRLIGHAQKGEKVNEALLDRPGPLAHIEGHSPKPSTLPSSPPRSPPSTALNPPLTPEDKTKFLRLFLGCGPANGLLSGDKARDVFVKSKLPFETLSQIWSLADTQDRGSLDQTDFTIAMYFIQAIMSGQLKTLPATLPPGLYEQAGGRGPTSVVSHGTGNSMTSLSPSLTGSFTPAVTAPPPLAAQTTGSGPRRLQPQTTGQDYSRLSMAFPPQPSVHFAPNPATALGASAFGTATQPWDVTPEEKTRFDQFFGSLDAQKRGFIEGDVAVPFMLQSKLSEDVLAQVWDLADLNNDGRLTRDGFAVAMHLIQGKLAGKDIPATLPLSLVPPAMRASRFGGAPAPATAPPAVPEPVRDLLWDDSPPASATSPPLQASTLGSPPPVHATPVLQPQLTGRVSQQQTGVASPKAPPIPPRTNDPFGAAPFSPPSNRDLLSDDEGTPSSVVPDSSAEIGNVQNQLNSTNRSLETTKAERQNVETTLATQASQLSALQTQLSLAKAAYETETKLLETLRERFAAQSKDIAQTREQLISAESDLSALRVEKAEVEGSLLRDKEEVRELRRRMEEVGEEAERTKAEIEKAKKETKHHKGLLAIAKKQLATRETERAKLAKELEDAEREAQETIQELQATEAELAKEIEPAQTNGIASPAPVASEALRLDTPSIAAQQPLPASPPPSIGSPSSTKATNPFERLMIQSTGSRPASPFVAPTTDIFSAPTPQTQLPAETIQASPFVPFAPEEKAADIPQTAHAIAAEPSTSTMGPASSFDDPFGLGDVDKSSATSVPDSPEKTSAPAPDFVTSPVAIETEDKAVTPIAEPEITTKAPERSPSSTDVVDTASKQFPAVDAQTPASFPSNIENDVHTDLDSKLVEKEVDESDSDSDSDNEGDFHDAKEARTSTGSAFDEPTKGLAVGTTSKAAETTPTATTNAFEDAFGLEESKPKAETSVSGLPANKDTMADLFFSEPEPIDTATANGKVPESSSPFDTVPTASSGVNAFDEAMGKISTPVTSSTAPRFQLDSAFDDNFDFTAAKAELEPASVPTAPVLNGTSQGPPKSAPDFSSAFPPSPSAQSNTPKPQEASRPAFSFDDAFGAATSSQSPSQPSQPFPGDHGISFEDAFGGGGNQALALNFNQPPAPSGISAQSRQSDAESVSQRIQSPPRSPKVTTTTSPPPAARSTSPPPRRSTGSSTDGSVHGKPPPQHRHSKLSIRLPFGRKDKKKGKHEPPPMPPPHFLTPVAEPQGANTPAVEDDVEPVKQLCSMGFSRSQAIEALEKYGYDVQRALNSLLGAS